MADVVDGTRDAGLDKVENGDVKIEHISNTLGTDVAEETQKLLIDGNSNNAPLSQEGDVEIQLDGQAPQKLKLTSESINEGVLLKAPDGGYGWVIVLACFLHHMVLGGFGRSEGLFFLQYQERFGSGAQLTSWPSSLMSTLNLFMGPLCGAVINRYSVRTALIIATILTSVGFILNGIAPNVYFLFFSQTLIGGIGRGLMSSVLLLNLYFDKRRSLAQGLSSAGVGFGAFVIVPLVQILFEEYGFTGAFMIIGAIQLNGLIAAMAFRPLSMHMRFLRADRLRKRRLAVGEEGKPLASIDKEFSEPSSAEKDALELDEVPLDDKTVSALPAKDNQVDMLSLENGVEPFLASCETLNVASSMPEIRRKTHKKDNWLKSSLAIIFPVEHKRKEAAAKPKPFHWNLLKNVPFIIFCVSNTFFLMAFKTAFTFMPAMAMSKGLTRTEAALVLTISGALDTFGRMAVGFVMDLPACRRFRPFVFNMLLFFIAGASFLVPSLESFPAFVVVSSIYGTMTGAFISQKIVVLVDIVGREVMPSALGINKVFQGIGTLVGPPFAGALRDAMGTFDSSFYLGGACMFGSGLLLALSNVLRIIQKKRNAKRAATQK
ncbi:monocarboxylate transporter 2-like [Biomphalaria glabrata]|uniref:Monocarboxylate transporter 2-like n=1 Tax=Biomphalaria glabrata TaxID=6526 RepID=A0A9W2Z2F4_BIOGL|nr:monocarboxylate transporter 2-like [Biomphalaria glabrata]